MVTTNNIILSFGEIIVYDDYKILKENGTKENISGIKVSNGNEVIVDLLFVTDFLESELINHINNTVNHITAAEKEKWNNKVICFIDINLQENLFFTID